MHSSAKASADRDAHNANCLSPLDRYLRVSEAAAVLGLAKSTLDKMRVERQWAKVLQVRAQNRIHSGVTGRVGRAAHEKQHLRAGLRREPFPQRWWPSSEREPESVRSFHWARRPLSTCRRDLVSPVADIRMDTGKIVVALTFMPVVVSIKGVHSNEQPKSDDSQKPVKVGKISAKDVCYYPIAHQVAVLKPIIDKVSITYFVSDLVLLGALIECLKHAVAEGGPFKNAPKFKSGAVKYASSVDLMIPDGGKVLIQAGPKKLGLAHNLRLEYNPHLLEVRGSPS